ncbi:ubiquitin carboxyl-terminal hydrolase CYLD-like isoform X2 [Natator depressus]|uniref:ubiquitin carboxyl-terminal hydrolase CYLD-like isoform X2 n=1 Tax=Natator depressus TaxID=27790 RepID=UPI003EBC06A2
MTGDRSHPPITMRPRRFFILLQDFSGEGGGQVPRGSLVSQAGEPPALDCPFWAKLLDTEAMVQVPARAARELSKEQAGMLQAVTNGDERLGLFRQEGLLRTRGALRPGDRVRVQITSASGEKVRGVLRYRGPMGDSKEQAGVIFGVELVGSAAGKGFTDGSFRGQKFFSCRENCGVFVPVSRIEPDEGAECSPLMAPRGSRRACTRLQLATGDPLKSSPPLELGDRVFFKMGDSTPGGTVFFCDYLPKKEMAGVFVGICLDQPVGSWDGKFSGQSLCHFPSPEYGILLPITKVHKEKADEGPKALSDDPSLGLLDDPPSPSSIRYPPRPEWGSPHGSPSSLLMGGTEEQGEGEEEEGEEEELAFPLLEINSMVEVHDPPIYGVIRWIGAPPDVGETIAGLELEEPLPSGCTDGIYRGMRYFQCPPGKALFVKLRHCRPDARFGAPQPPENPVLRCNSLAFRVYASERVPEDTPPGLGEEGGQRLMGWKKGIQGHCNSCYLDATLFCMFAFSSVLDSLLLRPADKNDGASYEETRDLLRTEIVNPLRKHGYVCATKVMSLRRVLEAAGHSPGFTSEEKDPEEFLTLLFRVLKVEPLFKIRPPLASSCRCPAMARTTRPSPPSCPAWSWTSLTCWRTPPGSAVSARIWRGANVPSATGTPASGQGAPVSTALSAGSRFTVTVPGAPTTPVPCAYPQSWSTCRPHQAPCPARPCSSTPRSASRPATMWPSPATVHTAANGSSLTAWPTARVARMDSTSHGSHLARRWPTTWR